MLEKTIVTVLATVVMHLMPTVAAAGAVFSPTETSTQSVAPMETPTEPATPTDTPLPETQEPTATATRTPLPDSYPVPDRRDLGDALPGDGVCADSRGICTLRAAVDEHNANPGLGTIVLASSTYTIGASLVINDALNVVGQGADRSTVRGGRQGPAIIVGPNGAVELSDLRIRGGQGKEGGNIRNEGTLSIRRAVVLKGYGDQGGGIYNLGLLDAQDVLLYRNRNRPPSGLRGPVTGDEFVSVGASIMNLGTATLDRVTIVRGQARRGCGGGLYNGPGATLVATNTQILRNRARQGQAGGICNVGGELTCINCTIARNQANNRVGGLLNLGGTVHLGNTLIDENFHSNRVRSSPRRENCAGSPIHSLGHNLDNGDTCGFAAPGDLSDAVALITSPLLFTPYTLASSVNPNSDAIDAGNNDLCPLADILDGQRPVDGDEDGTARCDIGAIEFVPGHFRP